MSNANQPSADDHWASGDGRWASFDDEWPSADDQWLSSNDPWPSPRDAESGSNDPAHWSNTDRPVQRTRRGGRHRMPPPPSALKGRAAVVAVAAGAFVAAIQTAAASTDHQAPAQSVEPMAMGQRQVADTAPDSVDPGLLDEGPVGLGQFADMLHNGDKVAEDISAAADAKLRPLFTKFTTGVFTSGYGMRWGALHAGVDVAAPIGTPIVAVEDGTVISAGPASGFGMWVRLLGDDGTITVYGHINTALVSIGQHVMAGDQIATVGNRGETTGPHCHFEVWLNGTDRVDPLPWLATRGISLGPERD
ncbi:M23 family metallopeptidase [Nocardia sp. NPDC049149]|uniref:M23 family metallopeptidase n=1 Tax=Nocardia sp. NPDC049149 TaxID=3364315 RepID=UPI003712B243